MLSPTLAVMTRKLSRLAPSDVDILLSGETGVGKRCTPRPSTARAA
jgi:DNA-binding NtrC family response regulator